jgi:hypothetical protein
MEAESFTESNSGQQLKADLDDLRQRVQSGETGAKVRDEVLKALKLLNAELEKAARRWSGGDNDPPAPSA